MVSISKKYGMDSESKKTRISNHQMKNCAQDQQEFPTTS